MRVLVAGATGVIGRQLVPRLLERGHDVVALSRSGAAPPGTDPERQRARLRLEAVDALDAEAVHDVVVRHAPDAIVHLLSQVPHDVDPRHMTRDFETTNRLRTEGLEHLLDAWPAPAGPLVTQGLAWAYDPAAVPLGTLATESAPLWRAPPRDWVTSRDALVRLEDLTAARDGLVLRLGHLHGPGTAFAADGAIVRAVRARRFPVVGGGTAEFSFTHTVDAATAVVAAIEAGRAPGTGSLNIVDDDPVPVGEWLPELARLLGAPPPRRVPALVARPVAGSWGVAFQTRLRGADNARARSALGWSPLHPSWRAAMTAELAGVR